LASLSIRATLEVGADGVQDPLPALRARRTVDGVMPVFPMRLRELRMSAEERRIERAVRRFKRELRLEAENAPERRAADLDARIWRDIGSGFGFSHRR
jgi:hypothetical protein